jgi:hypothetical protein
MTFEIRMLPLFFVSPVVVRAAMDCVVEDFPASEYVAFSERSETLRKIETSHAPSFRSGQKHTEPSISACDEVIGKKVEPA